jgi:hypothetical protein
MFRRFGRYGIDDRKSAEGASAKEYSSDWRRGARSCANIER